MRNIKTFESFADSSSGNIELAVGLYEDLEKGSDVSLSGGNCGQSAYAVYRWMRENTGAKLEIGVLTNAEDEEWLVDGEPDVYHVVVVVDGTPIDETGVLTGESLLSIAKDQYLDLDPSYHIFSMPEEERKVLRIISTSTNYTVDWNYFYDILEPSTRHAR